MTSKLARWLVTASLLTLAAAPLHAATQGWLGVTTQPTDADLRKGLDLTKDGLLVNQVSRDSPADRAGLRKGDVILTYNSRSVTTPEQLRDQVRDTDPGRTIALGIWRDGKNKSLDVKVGDVSDSGDEDDYDAPVPPTPPSPPSPPRAPRPPSSTRIYSNDGHTRVWVDGRELDDDEIKDKMKDMKNDWKSFGDGMHEFHFDSGDGHTFWTPTPVRSRGRLGVRIDNLNDDMAQALGVPSGGKGALVTEVLEDTPAQKAGIRAGDVIVKVQGESVDDPDDLTRALRNHDGKVSLELLRKGARRTIDVEIPSRESTSRSGSRIPEPGPGSWGFSKTRDDDSAALRQEIEDLKKELQELREQIKAKK